MLYARTNIQFFLFNPNPHRSKIPLHNKTSVTAPIKLCLLHRLVRDNAFSPQYISSATLLFNFHFGTCPSRNSGQTVSTFEIFATVASLNSNATTNMLTIFAAHEYLCSTQAISFCYSLLS